MRTETHRNICVFRTKTRKNDGISCCDVSLTLCELQTLAPTIFSVIVSILMRFRPFSTVHTNTLRFRFDPLLRAFSDRCGFDENAQRISEDRNTPKCKRSQTKTY